MRTAIFTRAYATQAWGGIPSVCKTLAEGLVREGHEVHVITTGKAGITSEVLDGVTIHYVQCPPLQYTSQWYEGAHGKYLELGKFDIAYSESGANGPFVEKLQAVRIARLHGVSYEEVINHLNLVYVQGRPLNDQDLALIGNKYIQYFKDIEILKKYDCLVAISDVAADIFRHRFFHGNVVTIYNAVDEKFRPSQGPKKMRFVAAGKDDPRKGFGTIRKAFDLFCKQSNTESELTIANGMSQDALADLYQTSWAFIDASNHFTGMNTACMEAMACGLPVICSDMENFREMTDNSQFYFPLGDHVALSKWMLRVCDPVAREELSRTALKAADRFSVYDNIKRHIALFDSTGLKNG